MEYGGRTIPRVPLNEVLTTPGIPQPPYAERAGALTTREVAQAVAAVEAKAGEQPEPEPVAPQDARGADPAAPAPEEKPAPPPLPQRRTVTTGVSDAAFVGSPGTRDAAAAWFAAEKPASTPEATAVNPVPEVPETSAPEAQPDRPAAANLADDPAFAVHAAEAAERKAELQATYNQWEATGTVPETGDVNQLRESREPVVAGGYVVHTPSSPEQLGAMVDAYALGKGGPCLEQAVAVSDTQVFLEQPQGVPYQEVTSALVEAIPPAGYNALLDGLAFMQRQGLAVAAQQSAMRLRPDGATITGYSFDPAQTLAAKMECIAQVLSEGGMLAASTRDRGGIRGMQAEKAGRLGGMRQLLTEATARAAGDPALWQPACDVLRTALQRTERIANR